MEINELILDEVRTMRKEMNDGFTEVKQRITAVETQTEPFFETEGGREKMQGQIDDLRRSKWMVLGGAGVLAGSIHTILKKLGI